MRWAYVSFALGISLCLTGAFLMFEGNILGQNNTGWAAVIGVVGIGLIGTSGAIAAGASARAKESTHANFERVHTLCVWA